MRIVRFAALAAVCIWFSAAAHAQYKAPSQYFRKDFPAPRPGAPQQSGSPKAAANAKPQQPKFKDLTTNATFYFLSDTNRSYAWTKVSVTAAKNTKTGATQPINGETPIQK